MTHGLSNQFLSHHRTTTERAAWTRPNDWPALPSVSPTDQKIVLFWAVFENSPNYFACTISGAYSIDWGDGAGATTGSAGATTYKSLAWASYTGSTSEGFRVAVITITPQAGHDLTSINLGVKHNQAGLVSNYTLGMLEVLMAAPLCSTFSNLHGSGTVAPKMLRRFRWLGTNAVTSFSYTFYTATALRVVEVNASSATATSNMFEGCSSLDEVTITTSSSLTSTASMFSGCSSLTTAPNFNTTNVTTTVSMFSGCVSLTSVPAYNLSAVTLTTSMFNVCYSLTSSPAITTTSALVGCGNMFYDCRSLKTIPVFDTSGCLTFANMFYNNGFSTAPSFVTTAGTNFSSMFQSCTGLATVPTYSTSSGTNFSNMFNACSALRVIPALNMAAGTTFTGLVSSCPSLESFLATGIRYAVSFASCSLGATALDAIYTNLGTAAGAQVVTVTSNYGTTGDTPSIATGKGWTVTGS